jgi:hypothetical protein
LSLFPAARLAGRIAGIATGFLLGLHGGRPFGSFFRLACDPCGFCQGGFFLTAFLLGLESFALLAGLFAAGCSGFPLLTPLHDFGIVGPGLGAEFVENIPPRFLRRLLTIRKSGFLEASHRTFVTSFGV